MTQIVGVQFKNMGKVYSFDATDKQYKKGDRVVVDTARGIEVGRVVYGNRETDLTELQAPLKPILRLATEEDLRRAEENRAREAEAMRKVDSVYYHRSLFLWKGGLRGATPA